MLAVSVEMDNGLRKARACSDDLTVVREDMKTGRSPKLANSFVLRKIDLDNAVADNRARFRLIRGGIT